MQLPDFKLERYFAKYEFTTEYLLCSSDCESMTIADLLALEPGAAEKFQQVWLGYTESQGSPTLRKEICKLYETIQPENVLVHSGAGEAIFLFMHAMLDAGDHVIVHAPGYQSLAEVARGIGCDVSAWTAREENNWALDLDELPKLLRPNTKAVILNTPHNPTGYLMSRADFDSVNRFARENGLLLFSDEVYRESEYDPAARLPAACDLGEYAVSLGVASKTYGLAGLRIGWIATRNKNIYQRMAALKDYTTICNSAPSEFLAEVAMRHRLKLAGRNLDIIKKNLTIIDNLIQRHADLFSWVRPRAGSMAFPRYLGGDVESFCDELVRKAGVLLLPGSVYDDASNHFRLGLGRRNLPEAVARLEEFLKDK
ncbi:MAG: aminotransferase class I/II-fold pyridoxal phosphate-dependent enzyme [Chloroflexi bacterium]|nr:aminotransferase class I/II-fold pyridoxal phosphate-dependent enzyme [Chloroflexota bacterium]MBI1855123.1 aminotransferase class I/II-fold pyridoxal phosphate-dependent enzyme [Chloroflexota bacterium]MBI3339360.1 aminotransferase class I/II-fold pyridoxal phosphate-dependent enzyme [Chloroflexota bacterium]